MGKTDYLQKLLDELPVEERERLVIAEMKKLTEMPEHVQQSIDLVSIGEIEEAIVEHHKHFGKFQGLTSGYEKIDQYLTRGLVGGEMTIIAGATSNGKSALAINMAKRIAERGHTVLFVTLEMTKTELGSRIYHIHKKPLANLPVLFQRNDELDWRDVDGLVSKAKENGAEIVFIDHLHYFTRDVEHQNESLARISKEIKKNAIRHNIPIVLLAQTRKGAKDKAEYTNDEISGSGAITQDADIVLFVRRDKEYPDLITVQMTKNRNRGHDFKNDTFVFDFKETIITDPEQDTLIDPWTKNQIDQLSPVVPYNESAE